jgi:hypothetical protein
MKVDRGSEVLLILFASIAVIALLHRLFEVTATRGAGGDAAVTTTM